ncbi:BZ3500_MvSof-1268-A1-R1_Chr10-1g02585 [Microbotryum saponariae]|uniref:BZ3500_MvSof-1268-A1-R1_Chr10-1g02585 protein n=1 Tax=Microbotryum saponariae TaxID=289078 RepID=A0A2X0LGC0_9BASI|nr:BZ3500_MvSof-1268-A1-R1_Chr10-1g02585 [Microbotryum saponariae]SDA06074.1 BZ3501_MvSof-1269-A2-R1_Chr10-1g02186 [Microbotryum saponariae]
MSSRSHSVVCVPLVLVVAVALICFAPQVHAFGAGNIPSFSYLEGKAFRSVSRPSGIPSRLWLNLPHPFLHGSHGDIEDILARIVKQSGGFLGRGSKFSGLDIKRIYFGNWLRDYSQAMDVAGLSKLPKQTILNLVMALGFLAHGYATGEFEVTDDRLGVYSTTEHIDNPKGYAADQPGGDARRFDPRLRPPVDPRELEIDPRTGMKNYIANESGGWDTSSRLVRERLHQCIELGRRARHGGGGDAETYEAFRLLGSLLHTLEDFTAHSNWCELSLRRLGYRDVFCHVGDRVTVQSPAGVCPPLVTGTFGGSDFIHSLLGEATDHISEASVSDLNKAMDKARQTRDGPTDTLRDLFVQLPGSTGNDLSREMNNVEDIRSRAANGTLDASAMSPQELHATLWQLLTFRDNVVKGIEVGISKIPGLSSLIEKMTDSVNRLVFTTLEPLLKPIMSQATAVLQQGSAEVIKNSDQYAVFSDPQASDPTHSFLSKDHFILILNEPAGLLATIIVEHAVKLVVNAWDHSEVDPNAVANEILKTFHHPYFYDDSSSIQREMGACLKKWIDNTPDKNYILHALTKQSVRDGKNKRKGHEKDQIGHGCGGEYNSILSPEKVQAFATAHVPGAAQAFSMGHQVSNYGHQVGGAYNSAQHYMGYRDINDGGAGPDPNAGGYQQHYNTNSSYNQGGGYQQPPPPPPIPHGYQDNSYQQGGYQQGGYPQGGYQNQEQFGGPPPPDPHGGPGGFDGGFQPPPPHGGFPVDQHHQGQHQQHQGHGQGYQHQQHQGHPGGFDGGFAPPPNQGGYNAGY